MLLTLSFIGQDQVSTGESPDTHLSHSEKWRIKQTKNTESQMEIFLHSDSFHC